MKKRLRAVICLLAATMLLLTAAAYCGAPVRRVAAVIAPGDDPLRAAAFENGIELALARESGLELRVFETNGSISSLRRIAARLALEDYCGVLTNVDRAELLADYRQIPVLTTGASAQTIRTTAGRDDEMRALLSYAKETGMESLAILLPESTQVWGDLLGWMVTHPKSNLYSYSDSAADPIDSIIGQQADGVVVWGDTAQVPRIIARLRHAGYTGAILGPSFLAGYEALGINAGQASGLRFAAQYTDPRHNAEMLSRRQKEFIEQYTAFFGEAPLFAESYYGYDQICILRAMLQTARPDEPTLSTLLRSGQIDGVVQRYDYSRNARTGVVGMAVCEIQSGHIEEAR
ncbi:MAG: ABC transporter substrate-binding protein [Eubacteriales bacterium]|nr:ABC transporter substrate-binding protein [Eubacteriales bacterium]